MQSFTTFNQFDKRFSGFQKFGSDRTACPLFGLITCHNFQKNGDISQKQHEINLESAINNYVTKTFPKYMLFDELVNLTNMLEIKNIGATTPELLTTNVVGYEHIFKFGYDGRYCILFLKNRNYIAILCDVGNGNEVYAVRDCHENTQLTFSSFDGLKSHLDTTYQFEQQTIVGGVRIPEFENMEFLMIDLQFDLIGIDNSLEVQTETKTEGTSNQGEQQKVYDLDAYLAMSLAAELEGDDYTDYV
jgi:hypothetical protein